MFDVRDEPRRPVVPCFHHRDTSRPRNTEDAQQDREDAEPDEQPDGSRGLKPGPAARRPASATCSGRQDGCEGLVRTTALARRNVDQADLLLWACEVAAVAQADHALISRPKQSQTGLIWLLVATVATAARAATTRFRSALSPTARHVSEGAERIRAAAHDDRCERQCTDIGRRGAVCRCCSYARELIMSRPPSRALVVGTVSFYLVVALLCVRAVADRR